MRLNFTKMHGAGNDFVVLDATRERLNLSPAQYRFLADRHMGVGADQILIVEPGDASKNIDFTYRIMNADGGEVEQCGNGARCFMRYVADKGLSDKSRIRVQTLRSVIEPALQADGRVSVDMGLPIFDAAQVPFLSDGLHATAQHQGLLWPITFTPPQSTPQTVDMAVASMGNPHVVLRVDSTANAPVETWGPVLEKHPRFPNRVNVGFMEVLSRDHIRLRVFERGSGETLACGSGACAAAVSGMALGWLNNTVDVDTHGGRLTIAWAGLGHPVIMTGPALTVFDGCIDIPDDIT
jgi:diaminopimelate epimerase